MFAATDKALIARLLAGNGISYDANATTVVAILDSARLNGYGLSARQRTVITKALRQCGIKDEPKYPRPGYRAFVEYIALNDDREALDKNLPSVCVSMVAHMFGKETDAVIEDVQDYLEKHND